MDLASLEAEAMVTLGLWKNFEELENSISLPELNRLMKAAQEKNHKERKFMAALKGVNLDGPEESSPVDKFEEIKRRARAKMAGKSVEELEFDDFGIDVETA